MPHNVPLQHKIIRLMLKYGTATRPELQKHLAVRSASLLEAIDDLKKSGILEEPERATKRTGRKAPQLSLAPNYLWCAGIVFSEDYVLACAVDMAGNIRYKLTLENGPRSSKEECLADIFRAVDGLKEQCGTDWSHVRAIGFADPGLVDIANGKSLRAVNLPGWRDVSTRAELESRYAIPAQIWPECAVSTFIEYLHRGRNIKGSLFYLGMGTGIGGGFIRDGECFFGDNNLAMEVGHVVVNPNGPLCQCGNRGCLEAIAGKNGIYRKIQETLDSGVNTILTLTNFSIRQFTQAAAQDKPARLIATELCESIGHALATVVTLLNPTYIVMRGDLTGLGDFLLDTVHREMERNCFPRAMAQLHLELSSLTPLDTARGAALLMRQQLFIDY